MSLNLPTLRQLRFLVALADYGSFSRAAEMQFVTQPTLSAGIKELEGTLGTVLVDRGSRGTELTETGILVVGRARIVITEAEQLVIAAKTSGNLLSGPFRLGLIPTIAPFLLPKIIPAIQKSYPKLELYLSEDLTERLIYGLKQRQIDCAIIALPFQTSGLDWHTLMDDEFLFACSVKNPLADKETILQSDLEVDELLLLDDGHCLRDQALTVCHQYAGRSKHQLKSNLAATSLYTLIQMVRSNLGSTLVPKIAVDAGLTDYDDLFIKRFDPPLIGRQIGLVWTKRSPRADEILRLLKTVHNTVMKESLVDTPHD